ncbi:MAG: dephospho-CoA kinase [Flavobacteriales bacterium]|nr:dephospho-CoA kinase [Flavobacteriales bacterium]|tara:strand:- start:5005 stop:5580 length:576 start_codon:yes stop_codon:yes gene_type:complete
MKKIGITGGIGSGKTYVSNVFEALGIPVFNSDTESKKLLFSSKGLIRSIINEFGDDIHEDYCLNKKKLATIVFSDADKLKKLNTLVHPLVKKEFLEWQEKQKSSYIIKESAILFESNSVKDLDAVICITAPLNLRIDRVKKRDRLSYQEIINRIENQLSQEDKEILSDFIIVNDGLQSLLPQILRLHKLFT